LDIINHAVTLISIIVGIGLTEMFGNLHRLIRNRSQVSWDWLPVLWAASLLVLVINYWWAIYQGIIGLDRLSNAAELGLILIQPILLFLLAASVLPSFGAAGTCDMRHYYEDSHNAAIMVLGTAGPGAAVRSPDGRPERAGCSTSLCVAPLSR
jgi:hypothetical protein